MEYARSAVVSFYMRHWLCARPEGSHFKHMAVAKSIPLLGYDQVGPERIDKSYTM